jgi:DegV family protein with EDD domain
MIEAGDDIIFIGISEEMSSTCNRVRIFAEDTEYDRLFVINSKNLSTGIGLQVLRAAELRDAGKSAEDIVSEIEGARDLVRASFVIDTPTFLARGGRCTAVEAFMANALKLHPEILVKDGKMGAGRKVRGKPSVAVMAYVDGLMPALKVADTRRVFITHSGSDREIIDAVKEKLVALDRFDEILVTQAGGVISSHCGPNTLGVLFYEV